MIVAAIKLDRLPDRTPVKITITVSPELSRALGDYASAYEAAYGQAEPVAELIPAMLAAFLESDRGFMRARRSKAATSWRPAGRSRTEWSRSRSSPGWLDCPGARSTGCASAGALAFRANMSWAAAIPSTAAARGSGSAMCSYGWIRGHFGKVRVPRNR